MFFVASFSPFFAFAQSITDLEGQIEVRQGIRESLEAQAAQIENELNQVGAEKGILQAELNRINNERKSLESSIQDTESEISRLSRQITTHESRIKKFTSDIQVHSENISRTLRSIYQKNNISLVELISKGGDFSEIFMLRDSHLRLQKPLLTLNKTIRNEKESLFEVQKILAAEQSSLAGEIEILDNQKDIIIEKENEQNAVLQETKSKESQYKDSLKTALESIAALDAEIRNFESKLAFAVNPTSLPPKGSEVLAWPLKNVLITQRFGRTVSSETLYVSGSHSGIDFRASVGTPVYAIADGTVVGVGDTDQACPRGSFGKWIFIEHDMGLSSTFGHMSSYVVSANQRVSKGQLIGYSGNTGHSTAPHLHLTIYATEGVDGGQGARITQRPSNACSGKTYTMPLAPTAAYLNPLDYLPATDSSYFKYN